MVRFYWKLLGRASALLLAGTGLIRTVVFIFLFLLGLFNKEWVRMIVKTWEGFSPWYSVAAILIYVGYVLLKVNYEEFRTLERDHRVHAAGEGAIQEPIQVGPPIVMTLNDFARDVEAGRVEQGQEVIKPRADAVFRYERRGFEPIFIEHREQFRQVVIGGTADNPDNVPLQRRRLSDSAKRLLLTAYRSSIRPEVGRCFVCDAGSDNPRIPVDDGGELVGFPAIRALQELQENQLIARNQTGQNLYCLTELGQAWAEDIIERGR